MEQKGLSVQDAIKKMEYFCAYQERCHREVELKLKQLGMFDVATEHIINHLLSNNFLNEERFAKSFARGKHNIKKWGWRRIEQELKFRDISYYNIKIAKKEIEDDYVNNFIKFATQSWKSGAEYDRNKKSKKWMDMLIRKGYETHLIYDLLNELKNK